VDAADTRFFIEDVLSGFVLDGDTVYQMGKNGGWLEGEVTVTCEDFEIPNDTFLLCQYGHDNTDTQKGDSGGPVFTWDGFGDDIALVGLIAGTFDDAQGAGTFFSAWTYVELEFDELVLDVVDSS
jgi:hypothetical protein